MSINQPSQRNRSETEYRIRINGGHVRFYKDMHQEVMGDFAQICADNPDDYVDIVLVRTEIVMNQYSYNQMKRHFHKQQG